MTSKKIDDDPENREVNASDVKETGTQEDTPAKCVIVNARPLGGVA